MNPSLTGSIPEYRELKTHDTLRPEGGGHLVAPRQDETAVLLTALKYWTGA